MSDNPYQSPQILNSAAMPAASAQQRPVAATVFGVLNLVFGGFHLCGTAISFPLHFGPFAEAMRRSNPALAAIHDNATFRLLLFVQLLIGLVLAVILLAAGVALLRLNPLGRTLSITYSLGAVLTLLFGLAINFIYVFQPMLERIDAARPGPERAGLIGGIVGGLFGGCFGMIYPVVLLIFMSRPRFAATLQEAHQRV